ncbi:MAG: phosphoglycerate dehydrogenase [Abditibacteriota bacterium]|nr:phosphoglycerate dehydrogenase [Abditibacteriota bacterium]
MPKVLVSDKLAKEGIAILEKVSDVDVNTGLSEDELCGIIGNYDGLVIRSGTTVTAKVLEHASRLKIIGRAGVGVDNVDVPVASSKGIIVCNSPGGNTLAAAELSIAMLMALCRNIPQAVLSMKNKEWKRALYKGIELYGKTIAILGLGKIGQTVAKRCQAFHMKVIAYDPFLPAEVAASMGVELMDLDKCLAEADFITLHLPKNKDTLGLINKDKFALMKDGVKIVNCARGGIIDDNDLIEALKSGKVSGAALDVYVSEPPDFSCELFSMDNVITTPHLGASTAEAQVSVAVDVAEQIAAVFSGGTARSAVNMPAIPSDVMEKISPYVDLAGKLAKFLEGTGAQGAGKLEIIYAGKIAAEANTEYIKRSAITGFLSSALGSSVNMINANDAAKDRGLRITETKVQDSGDYSSLITLKASVQGEERFISGTVFDGALCRITNLNGFKLDASCEGINLVIMHYDKPGVIGCIGSVLGNAGINIAGMNVGRNVKGREACMLLSVDSEADAASIEALAALDNVISVNQIHIG